MIKIKTPEEIEIMTVSGHILAETLFEVLTHVKPGVSEIELDKLADRLIVAKGGYPGFKKVKGYNHATCISTNDVVVHGIPSIYKLKEGDVIGIDCGVFYKGYHTDMSETLRVSSQKSKVKSQKLDEIDKFLEAGKKALEEGIKAAKLGNHVGDISKAIQDIIEVQNGYSIVRSLVGHGVGKDLHEEPEVPGYLAGDINKTSVLEEGMTIAVEVIYNMGKSGVVLANDDGWTIKTEDGSLSGVFERTIAISQNGPITLTS
ncbi:MAG: type I methionyl aminopeptidase [Patescibacteria group bacterium]|nr:type I methionyl aminopeptidase [Patescibacteria group bacterium]